MEKINHNELEHSLFWSSGGSNASQTPFLENLNLNINSSMLHSPQIQQFARQFPDRDSSSTQSMGQSPESGCLGYGDDSCEVRADSDMKFVLSLGTPELRCSSIKADNGLSPACVPFPYPDTYLSGMVGAYGGQHSIIHPQVMGRVPLPLEVTEDGPIYVNAKQFHAILRRRQLRAKQEAQNKVSKSRKPYLHESRHLHAMKRVRGSDGRFVNTKLPQPQRVQHQQPKTDARSIYSSSPPEVDGGGNLSGSIHLCLKNSNISTSGESSSSEASALSNMSGGFHLADHLGYADFHSHVDGPIQSGLGMLYCNGHRQMSLIR